MNNIKYKHYLVSDLHLFHQRIIKYADRTKYEDTEDGALEMTYDIVNFINENIPDEPGVVLWNLGDLFYGPLLNKQPVEELQRLVSIMRGKYRAMNLIIGNHDRDFRHLDWKKINNADWVDKLIDEQIFRYFGFTSVYSCPIVFGGFIFSHEPIPLSKDSLFTNIHGHTHNIFVDENYFTWKCENHDMVKKAFMAVGRELPKNIDDKYDDWEKRLADPHKYINACWDMQSPTFHLLELNIDPSYNFIDVVNLHSKEN